MHSSRLSPLLLSPPSSLPLPFQRTKKRKRELFITGIFPAMNLFFITVFNKFQKIAAGENYSHYSFILIQKQKGCNCNDFVEDGTPPESAQLTELHLLRRATQHHLSHLQPSRQRHLQCPHCLSPLLSLPLTMLPHICSRHVQATILCLCRHSTTCRSRQEDSSSRLCPSNQRFPRAFGRSRAIEISRHPLHLLQLLCNETLSLHATS